MLLPYSASAPPPPTARVMAPALHRGAHVDFVNSLVRLRPRFDTLYVSQGRTVLATGLDGFIDEGSCHGLFVHETRLLSRYRHLINGARPHPVALSNVDQHSWLGYYICFPPGHPDEPPDTGSGQIIAASQQTLELRLSRFVGEGLHEDVDVANFAQHPTQFRLSVELDGDFADQAEATGPRQQRGTVRRHWRQTSNGGELAFDYRAEHEYAHQGERGRATLDRGVVLRIRSASSTPVYEDGCLGFAAELAPHETWHACFTFLARLDGQELPLFYGCRSFGAVENGYERRKKASLGEATRFTSDGSARLAPVVVSTIERAKRDLAALRLYDLDHGGRGWVPAAGLPIYIALFGRDVLTAAWQAALLSPDMMHGSLQELARWSGRETNDWRDEQPGRMLHEAHTGPLEMLNYNPRARYFGSATTSAFYPVVLSELWHWTGNRALVAPLAETALHALRCLDHYGDIDGDGFYEYRTRSEHGVKNQGWKDSGDAIVYEDGRQVPAPIATCEEQAFVYVGKCLLSEVLWWLGQRDQARRLWHEARELKKRFNDAFWMPSEGFFAMGLDPDKRQIRSIGSNPGHCLAAGITDSSLALSTADRLMTADLFSGWGVRTLSSAHPAYNPYSYHRGSVWPVEQGTFALAFMRYGLHDHLEGLCRAQFEAAVLFDHSRLPELFSGHARDRDHPFPALYPQANSPQAWSASAVFCLLQALLGLYPYAPLHVLVVDPRLPAWLPDITLEHLRVGDATATIRFYRTPDGTSDYRVLDRRGTLHILRQPSPWSFTASFAERLADTVRSLLPGK
jgi:glycogen debranching enzyme